MGYVLLFLSVAPPILLGVAVIIVADGQRRSAQAQVTAIREFKEHIARLGQRDG